MSPDVLIGQLLRGVLLPAVTSGLIFLALRSFWRSGAAPIALAAGFLAGFTGLVGVSSYAFPPQTVQQLLPVVAVVALVLGILETFWRSNPWVLWGVRLVVLELLLWRIFNPFLNHPFESRRWGLEQAFTNFALTTVVIVVAWWFLDKLFVQDRIEDREAGERLRTVLPTALLVVMAGSSVGIVLAHSLIMALLTAVVTAAFGALAVLCLVVPGWRVPVSASPVVMLLLALPWLSIYSTLPVASVLLLVATLGLLWGGARWLSSSPPWQRYVLPFALTALPVAGALWLAA